MEQRGGAGTYWPGLAVRLGLWALGFIFSVTLLPRALGLLWPFWVGLWAAWVLERPVEALERRLGCPRSAASGLAVVFFVGAAAALLAVLCAAAVQELSALVQAWPEASRWFSQTGARLTRQVDSMLSSLPRQVQDTARAGIRTATRQLEQDLPDLAADAAGAAGRWAQCLPGAAASLLVFLLATWMLSARLPALRAWARRRLRGTPGALASGIRGAMGAAFGGYLRAQLILAGGVFVILCAGLALMGQDYALLISAALALVDAVPLLGAGLALVPWAAVELLLGRVGAGAGLLALWGAVTLLRQLLEPRLLGRSAGLDPLSALAGIYLGMRTMGVAGMILGPVLVLALVHLWRQGVFAPLVRDLATAAAEIGRLAKKK